MGHIYQKLLCHQLQMFHVVDIYRSHYVLLSIDYMSCILLFHNSKPGSPIKQVYHHVYKSCRHVVTLPDGGILALDIGVDMPLPLNSPILLILPGLTG